MAAEQSKPRAKVRKIFKIGEVYQCGLCGSSFANLADVQANLKECTKSYLESGGALEATPKRYRCSYCKRIYDSVDAATACSSLCKKQIEDRVAGEQRATRSESQEDKLKVLSQFVKDPAALNALQTAKEKGPVAPTPKLGVYVPKKTEILAGENVKFSRDKDMYRCMRCKQRYKSGEEARTCFENHGDNFSPQSKGKSGDARYVLDGKKFRCTTCERLYSAVEDVIKCNESHNVVIVGKTKKEGESPIYFRDGAKYVCRKCGKKYFSREEVVTCFETGKDAPETDVAIASKPTATTPVAAKSGSSKKEDADKFYRDGAKYVCRGCNKKYFGKDETIACFASHAAG